MKLLKSFATAAALLVPTIGTVNADPIVGEIAFIGGLSVNPGPLNTTVHFNNPFSVLAGSGDYSGIGFAPVQFTDFTFTTATSTLTAPVVPLWNIASAGFSFDLLSLTSASVTDNLITLGGQGIGKSASHEDTWGSWGLVAAGNSYEFRFALSGSAVSGGGGGTGNSVPDGGSSALLFGLALLGISIVAPRLKRLKR